MNSCYIKLCFNQGERWKSLFIWSSCWSLLVRSSEEPAQIIKWVNFFCHLVIEREEIMLKSSWTKRHSFISLVTLHLRSSKSRLPCNTAPLISGLNFNLHALAWITVGLLLLAEVRCCLQLKSIQFNFISLFSVKL